MWCVRCIIGARFWLFFVCRQKDNRLGRGLWKKGERNIKCAFVYLRNLLSNAFTTLVSHLWAILRPPQLARRQHKHSSESKQCRTVINDFFWRGQDLSLFTWGCLFIVQCTVSSCHYFDLWGFPFSPIEISLIYNFIRSFNCEIKPQASRCGRSADAPKNWVKADRSPQGESGLQSMVNGGRAQRWQSTMNIVHVLHHVYLKAMIESGSGHHSEPFSTSLSAWQMNWMMS